MNDELKTRCLQFIVHRSYFIVSSAGFFFNPQSEIRIPQSHAPRRRGGVEVGDAFDEDGARDAEEEHAVEPVVADAVAAVDGERDGELVEPEPAVEGEADRKSVV